MPPPLITHLYTADPSAHVFEGKIYIYPSHDRESNVAFNDNGDQFDMNDYHVFSTPSIDPPALVTDHGVVLKVEDVPWASKQLWAPDAAVRDGVYYLFFPARDKDGIFRIGVARGDRPEGPFKADPDYIPGSYSIDPAVLVDDVAVEGDKAPAYLYFGGLWGGQLQCYQGPDGRGDGNAETYDAGWLGPKEPSGAGVAALGPRVVRLAADDMGRLAEAVRAIQILAPETGQPIAADDHDRRFFEAAWMHKRNGLYYFSYSTGDTHYLCYATGTSPYGPFTYRGRMLEPVVGWTTHHSVVEFEGRWYLFHHDSSLSGGVTHLRSVKVKEIFYNAAGDIVSEPEK
ncbi:alpha-N-arabinofuranosidase [Sporothrix brasiliensis 5110]|uniref:Alpha-N-arabinofuranosidase n=1 Tax=Sporothrix brasiliensis 5110 TaxID=1398154 RepID=A0A0C2IKC4_9PEZI|nr:alpha-N-arabinofuranosidase [Sporothrix brasiliensis 5110]KIH87450.1 alpha-N-arabinofuranosidase [Sporothrix brasiliensis 5110]